jgi:hypothetical protein
MPNLEIPERTAFFAGPGNSPSDLHNRRVQPAMLRLCECLRSMRSRLHNRQYLGCKRLASKTSKARTEFSRAAEAPQTALGLHAATDRNATTVPGVSLRQHTSAEKAEMERRRLSLVHELRSQLAVKSADSQI